MTTLFDKGPPHPCERLARIEGQSNFLGLLAGLEAGPDTTEDMAALAFSRRRDAVPEALEAKWGGSIRHKIYLCGLVYDELSPDPKDKTWVRAAILDGFKLFREGWSDPARPKAKLFKVRVEEYRVVRKFAHRLLENLASDSERPWIVCRFAGD